MQIKSGIDIIEVERIKSSIDEMGDNFLNRVYTENEIQYCESKKKKQISKLCCKVCRKRGCLQGCINTYKR